ncbi:hypothetical protein [Candidatus Kryptobacter tengchongensis]|nr:hypothetical protein [Candidatus Kryptobacter tengchongensis]
MLKLSLCEKSLPMNGRISLVRLEITETRLMGDGNYLNSLDLTYR